MPSPLTLSTGPPDVSHSHARRAALLEAQLSASAAAAAPEIGCPIAAYRALVAGGRVILPGTGPARLEPGGQPLTAVVLDVLLTGVVFEAPEREEGGYLLPGCLAPLRERTADGAVIYAWAAMVSEARH